MGIVLKLDLARLTSEIMRTLIESHGTDLGYADSNFEANILPLTEQVNITLAKPVLGQSLAQRL
jgi:hypothetical protein